MIMLFTQNVI